MPTRVQFPAAIEPLVQFIEDTEPREILDHTLAKLRAGVPIRTLLTASALAVTRSSDLPRVTTVGRCIHWSGSTPCITSPSVCRGTTAFCRSCSMWPCPSAPPASSCVR